MIDQPIGVAVPDLLDHGIRTRGAGRSPTWRLFAHVDSFRLATILELCRPSERSAMHPQETNSTCVDPGGAIGDTQLLGFQDGNLR
jgi:hypothetical protein